MHSNLSFLSYYKKDELVKYIASLFLMRDNSSQFLGLSSLMCYALIAENGKGHVDYYRLAKQIKGSYSDITNEEPQEYLFVDCVHTPEGSFRVFPGYFTFLHGNLTRLFCIAEHRKISKIELAEVYALLSVSDNMAEKARLHRYERGNDQVGTVCIPNYAEIQSYQRIINYSHHEIAAICERYGIKCSEARKFLLKPKASAFKATMRMEEPYSPIDRAPFYHTAKDEFIVLQPFSVLTCAYLRGLEILRGKLGDSTFESDYLEFLMADIHRVIRHGDRDLRDKKIFGHTGLLVYQMDSDKVARICVKYKSILNQDNEVEVSKYVEEKYSGMEIMKVSISNAIDIDMMMFGSFESLSVTVENFELMMGQEGMNLLNLFYYYQSRLNLPSQVVCQEIDLFAYYCKRGHTFYSDQTYSFLHIGNDIAFDMRCSFHQRKDYHIGEVFNRKTMLVHDDDMPVGIPVFKPDGQQKHPIHVGEYRTARVMLFYDNGNEDEANMLGEVAKSILVWLYVYEYRFEEPLLKNGSYIIYLELNDDKPVVGDRGDNTLKYEMPRQFFYNRLINDTHEHVIFAFLLESLAHFEHLKMSDWKKCMELMFKECRGQQLQVNPEGNDEIVIHDRYDSNYRVNEHECDMVLDDIARFLNRKGKGKKLDVKESENVIKQVIEYLGSELNMMLVKYASPLFVRKLLELHHATLFWLALTEMRFDKVNQLYAYIGADYSEQLRLKHEYSETNNLTMCLIERIVVNGYHQGQANITVKDIDRIYAYMHQLFSFGIYLDYLKVGVKDMEIAILPNGRIALPHKRINETQKYFHDLVYDEMYRRGLYLKLFGLEKGPNADFESPEFQDAFLDEYGITFNEWVDVINECRLYSSEHGEPIVELTVAEFESDLLHKAINNEHINAFWGAFCLCHEMIKKEVPLHESFMQRFNRIYQMSSRPWVRYNGRVLFSIKSIYNHLKVMSKRFDEGKINAYSQKMRDHKGVINKKKGDAFNDLLYDLYVNLEQIGLVVEKEVKIGPKERIKAIEPLGDFDLLLVDRHRKVVVCIEAKNYSECRTVYELLSEEKKIRGDLKMVQKRDIWAKKNLDAFKVIDKNVNAGYKVKTLFITPHRPVHPYFIDDLKSESITYLSSLDILENPMVVFEG